MRYNDPVSGEANRQAVGLDAVLLRLRDSFNQIPWLNGYVFLRAYENKFNDKVEGSRVTPQVYVGNGEYYEALLNDNLPGCMFFTAIDGEKIIYDKSVKNRAVSHTRRMALVFSANLEILATPFSADYIYTEPIKMAFFKQLNAVSDVQTIDMYVDDPVEEVYRGFAVPERMNSGKWPFAHIRIEFTVNYKTDVRNNC